MANYNPYSVHPVLNFGLGMNDLMEASLLTDNELADCENFSVDEGMLSTAPGYILWDTLPQTHRGPYWGGFMFKKSDGTMVNIRQRKNLLEYSVDGTTTWTQCTLPTTGSPATQITLTQVQPSFAALNDICIFTNGYENVMSSTDGITWTSQPSLPKSKVVFENAKNRLLYLAQTGSGRQFRFDWSDINAPLTISASSYQLVDPNNNGVIVGAGMTPDGTTLIMKEAAVYSVADFVDNGIIDINYIGQAHCANHHTICTTKNSVIWASFPGANVTEYIGGQLRTISGRINPNGRNDALKGDFYCAAYYNNKYRLSLPDTTISDDYNSQEYVYYLNAQRNDPTQPYPITRNRRYIGMYFIEDNTFAYGRDITLYFGDSRSDFTQGSPATYGNTVFAWVNDFRDEDYISGLNGEAQTCYFVTKYFTENMAYFAKKYKKLFANMRIYEDTTVTLSYRFLPFGSWTDTVTSVSSDQMQFSEGYGFSEGYSFSSDTLGDVFVDINNAEKPRGIQFKFTVSTTKDISNISLAFSYLVKPKFR